MICSNKFNTNITTNQSGQSGGRRREAGRRALVTSRKRSTASGSGATTHASGQARNHPASASGLSWIIGPLCSYSFVIVPLSPLCFACSIGYGLLVLVQKSLLERNYDFTLSHAYSLVPCRPLQEESDLTALRREKRAIMEEERRLKVFSEKNAIQSFVVHLFRRHAK